MSQGHRIKVDLTCDPDGRPAGSIEVDGKKVFVNELQIHATSEGVKAVITVYDIDLEFTGQARVDKLCGYCNTYPLLQDKKTCGHGECVQSHCALA